MLCVLFQSIKIHLTLFLVLKNMYIFHLKCVKSLIYTIFLNIFINYYSVLLPKSRFILFVIDYIIQDRIKKEHKLNKKMIFHFFCS